jgi:ribosome-associated protein
VTVEDLLFGPGLTIAGSDLEWRFSTAGGPGGQHVNTSHTRAEVTLDLRIAGLPEWAHDRLVAALGPVVSASASDTRSQARNRALALDRLARKLESALEVKRPRRPTRPSRAASRRRVEAKLRRGALKRERRSGPRDGE